MLPCQGSYLLHIPTRNQTEDNQSVLKAGECRVESKIPSAECQALDVPVSSRKVTPASNAGAFPANACQERIDYYNQHKPVHIEKIEDPELEEVKGYDILDMPCNSYDLIEKIDNQYRESLVAVANTIDKFTAVLEKQMDQLGCQSVGEIKHEIAAIRKLFKNAGRGELGSEEMYQCSKSLHTAYMLICQNGEFIKTMSSTLNPWMKLLKFEDITHLLENTSHSLIIKQQEEIEGTGLVSFNPRVSSTIGYEKTNWYRARDMSKLAQSLSEKLALRVELAYRIHTMLSEAAATQLKDYLEKQGVQRLLFPMTASGALAAQLEAKGMSVHCSDSYPLAARFINVTRSDPLQAIIHFCEKLKDEGGDLKNAVLVLDAPPYYVNDAPVNQYLPELLASWYQQGGRKVLIFSETVKEAQLFDPAKMEKADLHLIPVAEGIPFSVYSELVPYIGHCGIYNISHSSLIQSLSKKFAQLCG